ncbi:ATP-binding protein [Candidatus Pelagibacter bacterium nBUS_36]|uniref:HAMP domain-containing sensor histidine kinase n=1 Tax=Candidatus Pelagibacter bacterium nBUS_36 TaxID=3374194 RepID=UPI003EB95821
MFSKYLKNLSILRKFLFINFIIFTIIGTFTIIYLNNVQPNLIKKKSINHTNIINNTIDNILRLDVRFVTSDIRKFLFSTRFIFQNLDRVIFFDQDLNLIGDTDTLDLDPRSFSTRLNEIEFESLTERKIDPIIKNEDIEIDKNQNLSLKKILRSYSNSNEYGKPYTFAQESLNQFKLTTIKNVTKDKSNIGYLAIIENANDIKTATDERKAFVIRTVIAVGFVILIFSFVLSRYFIKPIQNLVSYTKIIKEKSQTKIDIDSLKNRNDELGLLSNSLDDMTNELQKRVTHAENFSTDLVHEIRNPLASLKSASEILQDTDNSDQRLKLINILSHDVQRIERLITDYSQMLKDEVALSKEKMKKINIEPIIQSVVDDYNNIYKVKKDIRINYENDGKNEYLINGIENRIEQIIANLLDNSISFSKKGSNIFVNVSSIFDKKTMVKIIDEGEGFKEKDTSKIFKRFYSNRPDKFGEHSGLGLNIVKNLVDLHDGEIVASNRLDSDGAIIEIKFPDA